MVSNFKVAYRFQGKLIFPSLGEKVEIQEFVIDGYLLRPTINFPATPSIQNTSISYCPFLLVCSTILLDTGTWLSIAFLL